MVAYLTARLIMGLLVQIIAPGRLAPLPMKRAAAATAAAAAVLRLPRPRALIFMKFAMKSDITWLALAFGRQLKYAGGGRIFLPISSVLLMPELTSDMILAPATTSLFHAGLT